MIIRCTQKLLAELKIKPTQEESALDSFWNCHANLFRIERHKCVIITNDLTLFTIFITYLKKSEFESFQMVISQHVFKNLLQENIPQPQIEAVLSECENISYQKTSNRRVLGSMNELIKQLEYFISSEGGLEKTDFYELNRELNRIILAATNHKRPIELLKERLKEITQ